MKHLKPISIHFLLLLAVTLFSETLSGQMKYKYNSTSYFDKSIEYHYKATYIDINGDTLTRETLILKPLGRSWIGQPWLQTAVRYLYDTDTAAYKNYIDPAISMHERNLEYYNKKGKVLIKEKETTGAYYDDTLFFYMHPPRTNQYRMLQYAPHPKIMTYVLSDTTVSYMDSLNYYGAGIFWQEKTIKPLPNQKVDDEVVKAWSMYVNSKGDLTEKFSSRKIYNSELDAVFTKEYGFIKLHYTFENDIKILFDLIDIVRV